MLVWLGNSKESVFIGCDLTDGVNLCSVFLGLGIQGFDALEGFAPGSGLHAFYSVGFNGWDGYFHHPSSASLSGHVHVFFRLFFGNIFPPNDADLARFLSLIIRANSASFGHAKTPNDWH